MALSRRQMAIVSLACHIFLFLLSETRWDVMSTVSHFAVSFLSQVTGWLLWSVFIYPHFISPLRHLSQPGKSHWLLGHRAWMHPTDIGIDAKKWSVFIEITKITNTLYFEETLMVSKKGQ
jgi:hypothetical protein